uniref:Putative secreted protein n=1 Tax=Anopheles darlingi TaxID=43151 RepID=A0A2M4DDQ4_ANODA
MNFTIMSRTRFASKNKSQTFTFIFLFTIKLAQASQSPWRIALAAATTCSRIDSGGPTNDCRSDERSC